MHVNSHFVHSLHHDYLRHHARSEGRSLSNSGSFRHGFMGIPARLQRLDPSCDKLRKPHVSRVNSLKKPENQTQEIEQRSLLKQQLFLRHADPQATVDKDLVEALIACNPNPKPLARPDLLYRAWRLLATNSEHILLGNQNLSCFSFGKFPPCPVFIEKIVQVIEASHQDQTIHLINIAVLRLASGEPGLYEMRAVCRQEMPSKLHLDFKEIVMYPTGPGPHHQWCTSLSCAEDGPTLLQAEICAQTISNTVYLDEELRIVASESEYTVAWIDQDPRFKP